MQTLANGIASVTGTSVLGSVLTVPGTSSTTCYGVFSEHSEESLRSSMLPRGSLRCSAVFWRKSHRLFNLFNLKPVAGLWPVTRGLNSQAASGIVPTPGRVAQSHSQWRGSLVWRDSKGKQHEKDSAGFSACKFHCICFREGRPH